MKKPSTKSPQKGKRRKTPNPGGKTAKPKMTWAFIKPQLKARARTDSKFRALLLKDPKAAFEKVANHKLPAGLKLKSVEETATQLYVIVPRLAGKVTEKDFKVIESDDWSLIIMENEDCPGDGNPPDGGGDGDGDGDGDGGRDD